MYSMWWEMLEEVLIQRVYIYAQKSAWGLGRGKDGLVFGSSTDSSPDPQRFFPP